MTEGRRYYRSRSSAIRAARQACRRALNSSIYSAYEGHDYLIQSADVPEVLLDVYYFTLRGPAAEAARAKDSSE